MFYVHPHLWGLFLVPKCQFWLYLHIIIYTKKISRETFLDPRSSYMWRRCSFCCVWLAWYFELMCQVISIQYSNCLGSFDVLKSSPEVECVNAVTAGGSVKSFACGVNFSRNNAIYNINESTKYILSWFHL